MTTDSGSEPKVLERERLLSGFLASVKVCQVRYGGRTELATESDPRVATLCQCLEETLVHGLRNRIPNRGMAAIRQVTDLVSSGLSLHLTLGNHEPEKPVLWWYVRELLTRHEFDRFLYLRNVHSDQGRGRAWLRSLLNEHSLERYIHIMLSDPAFLELWYEPWALLRDQERAAMLPNLAAGLDSILFAISIDNEDLNIGAKVLSSIKEATEKTKPVEPEPQMACVTATGKASPKKLDHKRRRRKVPSQIVSFDEDILKLKSSHPATGCFSAPSTSVNSPAGASSATPYSDCLNEIVNERELERAKQTLAVSDEREMGLCLPTVKQSQSSCRDKDIVGSSNSLENISPTASHTAHLSYKQALEDLLNSDPPSFKAYAQSRVPDEELQKGCERQSGSFQPDVPTLSGDGSQMSGNGACDMADNNTDPRPVLLIPLQGGPSNLIPLSPDGEAMFVFGGGCDDDVSTKSSSLDDEFDPEEVYNLNESGQEEKRFPMSSSTSFGSVVSGTSVLSSPTISKCSTVTASSFSSLTYDELRAAVLEISRARDAAEEKRNEVTAALTREMDTSSTLKAQLTLEQNQYSDAMDRITGKVSALNRENELLRHQLKKYVGAVQMLRREGIKDVTECGEESKKPLTRSPPDLRDYHDEAAAYESKLIQVAEMHGELMEFNERLQRLLKFRESQVRHLKNELIELRGPFPNEDDGDDDFDDNLSITSDFDILSSPRPLINIWIPTAFLAGPSSDTHHVYQIYVRIHDDEWNVYRRFAQFYELHRRFKKKEPIVKTFDFPQKKTFGYKDISVVENRRIRLQQYLRKLVNLLLSSHANLASDPDKASLTVILPFLSDAPNSREAAGSNGKQPRKFLSRLSSSGRTEMPAQPSPPQYNGL